jgi:hypothetical protein
MNWYKVAGLVGTAVLGLLLWYLVYLLVVWLI